MVANSQERATACARELGPKPTTNCQRAERVTTPYFYAPDRNLERDAVPHERDYLRDALSRSMDRATVSEIQAEFEHLIRRGEFVEVEQTAGPWARLHHADDIALEQRTMALMREAQQQTQPPLIHPSTQATVAREYNEFSADQRAGRGRDLPQR